MKNVYRHIKEKVDQQKKMLAFLIDPDKAEEDRLKRICTLAEKVSADFLFVGGSLLTSGDLERTIAHLKECSELPIVIFPGSPSQISKNADALLFLSLLSSRNPEMLIGQQVVAAPYLKKTDLEVIGTAYLLIEGGKQTTASYISNSNPIPADKEEIAAFTSLAGEYLGMKLIYLDAGSGAAECVPPEMIKAVKDNISIPLIVGGGINSIEKIESAYQAGADLVVIGNAIEKEEQLFDLSH